MYLAFFLDCTILSFERTQEAAMANARSIEFQYDFKPFGTSFKDKPADKGLTKSAIAVDIGAECYPYSGGRMVFDHHFERGEKEEVHPSAGCAVFRHAADILAWADAQCAEDGDTTTAHRFRLLAHAGPDFDALCALYLVRTILEDRWPELPSYQAILAALQRNPDTTARWYTTTIDPSIPCAWAFFLARYSAHVDNCRRITTAREKRLHSVVYAAQARGRSRTTDGMYGLFSDARRRMESDNRDPLCDSIFTADSPYAPELELLEASRSAYSRDLTRSYIETLGIPRARKIDGSDSPSALLPVPLLTSNPLVSGKVEVDPRHTAGNRIFRDVVSTDCIFLRDPECLLFKEWAREDIENSPLGQGFGFTMVAVSGQHSGSGTRNNSEYYISLDPERAEGRNLYPVWSALQRADIEAIYGLYHEAPDTDEHKAALKSLFTETSILMARDIFRYGSEGGRATNCPALFSGNLVWYDGSQPYNFTTVQTPSGGTRLASGKDSNLRDDAVAKIVLDSLWSCSFEDSIQFCDIPFMPVKSRKATKSTMFREPVSSDSLITCSGSLVDPRPDFYRFVRRRISRSAGADSYNASLSIARRLWTLLDPRDFSSVPDDFREKHVLVEDSGIYVWNRFGIACAIHETVPGTMGVAPATGADSSTTSNSIGSSTGTENPIPSPPVEDSHKGRSTGEKAALDMMILHALQYIAKIMKDLPEIRDEVATRLDTNSRNTRKGESNIAFALLRCREIMSDMTWVRIRAARPDSTVLRRFIDSTGVDAILDSVSDLSEQIYDAQESDRDIVLQQILAVGSALGLSISWLQIVDSGAFNRLPQFILDSSFWTSVLGWPAALGIGIVFLVGYILRSRRHSPRGRRRIREDPAQIESAPRSAL